MSIAILSIIEILVVFCFRGSIDTYDKVWWFLYVSPYFRIIDYTLGMLAGMSAAEIKDGMRNHICRTGICTLLEMFAIVIILWIHNNYAIIPISFALGTCWTIPCLFLIYIFSFGRGILSLFFTSKPIVYLGKLNYPMYIVHQVFFDFIQLFLGVDVFYNS